MCCNNSGGGWDGFDGGINRRRAVHGDCLYHTNIGRIRQALQNIERGHRETDRGLGLYAGCRNGNYIPVGSFVGRGGFSGGVPFGNNSLCENTPRCTSSPNLCRGRRDGWDDFGNW